jgi:hypothetical protein
VVIIHQGLGNVDLTHYCSSSKKDNGPMNMHFQQFFNPRKEEDGTTIHSIPSCWLIKEEYGPTNPLQHAIDYTNEEG